MVMLVCCFGIFFFFSSRRRHTRWTGDWSSDVCSSDLIAVENVIVLHGVALHLENESVLAAREIAERDGFAILDGFEGTAGGDASHERKADGMAFDDLLAHGLGKLRDFDGAGLIVAAADEAFFLKRGEMLVHRGERRELEAAGDLLEAGRIAALVEKADQIIENFLLPLRERHRKPPVGNGRIMGEVKAKVNSTLLRLTDYSAFGRRRRLLITQGNHRIDLHGAAGGEVASSERHEGEKKRDAGEGQRIPCADAEEQS